MNIANINVVRAITHEVVRAAELEERPPILSDDVIELEEKGHDLIRRRLTAAISSGSHSVDVTVDDASNGSPFHDLTSLLDRNEEEFVQITKQLANSLSLAQTSGAIKSGTSIFIQGTCVVDSDSSRFIAVIKADSDQAFYKRVDDEHQISLTYVSDMLLGESQRLIKIGFFVEEQTIDDAEINNDIARQPENFSIKVFDHMLKGFGDGNAARYFYGTFLRCRQADNSARKTKQFFETARSYIDGLDVEQDEKVNLRGDLISYMRGNRTILESREFAQDVLPHESQDGFLKVCRESEITGAIEKDVSLLKGKLRRQSVRFSSQVIMYASPDVFRESVRIFGQSDDGWTDVKIKGLVE